MMMQLTLFAEKEEKKEKVEVENIELIEFNPFKIEKRLFNPFVEASYRQNPYRIGTILQENELFEKLYALDNEMKQEAESLRVNRETLKNFIELYIKRVVTDVKNEKMYFVETETGIKIVAYLYEKQKGLFRIKDINDDFEYLFVINYFYYHQDFFYEILKNKLLQTIRSVPKARNPFNTLKNLNLKWYPPYSLNGFSLMNKTLFVFKYNGA